MFTLKGKAQCQFYFWLIKPF